MTSFIYTQNVPNPPNLPSEDVGNMQTNTNSIFSILNVDHESFGSASNIDGRHRQVSLINEAAPGVPANIGGVLFANNPVPQISWPFWQNTQTIQILGANVSSFAQFAINTAYGTPPAGFTQQGGFSFLPGALIFQYGFYGKVGALGNSGTIQFPISFNNLFNVMISLNRTASGNQSVTINTTSNASFTFLSSTSGSDGIFWTAIGN